MTSYARPAAVLVLSTIALAATTGCGSLSPPFDKMKNSQMTVYRLNPVPPPPPAAAAPAANPMGGLGQLIPPQVQQFLQQGAQALGLGALLPPTGPTAGPTAPDVARFPPAPIMPNFPIIEYRSVTDASVQSDILDAFGHDGNFQASAPTCMYPEFGFAIGQPDNPTPADILVSLSCEQVQGFNFNWPYPKTGITPDTAKKFAAIVQKVFGQAPH
jgi:hypothetical protein